MVTSPPGRVAGQDTQKKSTPPRVLQPPGAFLYLLYATESREGVFSAVRFIADDDDALPIDDAALAERWRPWRAYAGQNHVPAVQRRGKRW